MVSLRDDEAEVMDGSFDYVPQDLIPTYELWVKRRSEWLPELSSTRLHEEDGE